MALLNQAALLDELFGVDRNCTVKKEITWDDESICKYYLAGFCPHDLFVNTKMSLGACPKVHDCKLFDKYRESSQILKMGYERRLKSFLQRYVDDVKKKIIYNVERMENGLLSGTEVGIQKRITSLEREINELVKTIEECGNEGRIEECSNLNSELEEKQKTLKYDRIELETQKRNTRERLEEVCNICGAYISKNDPRNSLENHVSGRIHCSYVKINEVLNELNETLKKADRNSIDREVSKEKVRSRDSSRHKHRSRDRKYESVGRSRDRSSESRHRKGHKKKRSNRSRSHSHGKFEKHKDRRDDYDRRRDRKDDYDKRKDKMEDSYKRKDKGEDSYKRKERKEDNDKRRERRDDNDKRKEKREDNDKRRERKDDDNNDQRDKKKDDRKDKSWGEI